MEPIVVQLPFYSLFIVIVLIVGLKQCASLLLERWKSKKHRELGRFQGPREYPLVGTVPHMIFTDFWDWANSMCKTGDPIRFWRFGHPMVFISSYEYAIQLLSNSNFNGKMKEFDMIYRLRGGSGLSTTPAALHTQKRKLLNHAFSRQIVENSLPIFCNEAWNLKDTLGGYAKTGEEFDLVEDTMKSMFRMVVRSDFGDTFMQSIDNIDAMKHMQALHTFANNMSARISQPYPWLKSDFIFFYLTSAGKETTKAGNILNGFACRAIHNRRQQRTKIQNVPESPTCYLDILLDLVQQGQMTDDDVISELNNFMGGAYDTTALTVCWTMLLLALHPQWQEKVYQEVQEIFRSLDSQSSSTVLTPQDTKRMKYLELCLKESLRLFPPAPIFPRSTVQDMQLADGRVIPAGVDVLIFAHLIHRDPKHFSDPLKFKPERHLETNPAYMPFSLGVRNCIGQMYGMYQSKVVLAYLCKEFIWETKVQSADHVQVKYQGLLYPKDGLYFKIRRRQ